jgi:putative PIN family toxin of toxin-antitoxin system
MKVLLDTNIWISGLLWGGKAREIIKMSQKNQIIIYTSLPLLNELNETLQYPKLQRRLNQLEINTLELIEEVKKLTMLCQVTTLLLIPELRDPKDKIVLETAITLPVDLIISGDRDLLTLDKFQQIPIMSMAQFLTYYSQR